MWAELSRDNRVLITAGADKTAKIWRMPEGELLHTFEGHQDIVIAARFRPGEKELVTCSGDGTARVWDVGSGKQRWVLKHDGPIYYVAYSPDGTRIVTTGEDSKARLWDADSGEWVADLPHGAPVKSAAFSPDSRQVATAALEREPRVWDARTGAFRHRLVGHASMARYVGYSPDGTRIFSGGADGAAMVWNAKGFERICSLVGHLEGVFRVIPSPDGKRLLTASWDGSAKLWDADRCRAPLIFGTPGAITDARVSADGTRLLTASTGEFTLYDTATRKLLQKLDAEGNPRFGAVSPDGRWIAGDEGKNVRLWDLLHPGTTRLLEGHGARVEDVAFSPDGALLASAGSDASVRVWNVAQGKWVATLPHPAVVRSVSFGANGTRLVSGSEDGAARLWDVRTSGLVRHFAGTREQRVVSVQLSTDGSRLVASGWPAFSKVWDVESGATLAILEHPAEVSSARFLAGGELVLTGCLDGASRVFEVKSGRLLDTFPQSSPINTLDLDRRNRFVTTGPKDAARVWSLPRMARSSEDVDRLVRCFIPLRLEGERLVKAQPFSCTREPVQGPAQVAQDEDHEDNP
ncbi:MAG: WD40 repeat domain-containing protein [Myxococcaceae bacterium]